MSSKSGVAISMRPLLTGVWVESVAGVLAGCGLGVSILAAVMAVIVGCEEAQRIPGLAAVCLPAVAAPLANKRRGRPNGDEARSTARRRLVVATVTVSGNYQTQTVDGQTITPFALGTIQGLVGAPDHFLR